MKAQTTYVLGVDPGFGNTGAVLLRKEANGTHTLKEYACWRNDDTSLWPVARSESIVTPMAETIIAWHARYGFHTLEVSIETPVYNANPKIFSMQMTLVALIEHMIWAYMSEACNLYLTEVNNKTSKKVLTGNGGADKAAMIAASPWANFKDMGLSYNQAHTLADAYAHALAGSGVREYGLSRISPLATPANVMSSEGIDDYYVEDILDDDLY